MGALAAPVAGEQFVFVPAILHVMVVATPFFMRVKARVLPAPGATFTLQVIFQTVPRPVMLEFSLAMATAGHVMTPATSGQVSTLSSGKKAVWALTTCRAWPVPFVMRP